jgi:tetratricopeptide (TPR) repeat protein
LSGLSAEQKAKGYNQLVDILYPEASKAFEAITLANVQKNKVEASTYTPIVNALNEAVKCDEFDNQPNDKGKGAPKFRKKNADRLANFRNVLINAANETTDPDQKLSLANAYINSSESPLFAEALKAGDPYIGYAQFFAAAAYYNKENWNKAAEYAEKALKCEDVKENAEQYLVSALTKNLKTKADTLTYIKKLNDINADKYMAQMASLYNQVGEKALSEKILNDAIAKDPNNKMAYAIKGENAMNARDWDEAIKNFKKTVEIDPEFTAVWFNLGVCASTKGFDLNEQLSENGRITTENDAKVKEVLKEAVGYYEKVRQLDPNREKVSNWPYQLRMLYNAIGDTEKANEISKMLGE